MLDWRLELHNPFAAGMVSTHKSSIAPNARKENVQVQDVKLN
jgi:hypothetical protein